MIIFTGLLLRLVFLGFIIFNFGEEAVFTGDSAGFYQTARNLLSGHGFSRASEAPFLPDARFPPLYPILMASSIQVSGSVLLLIFLQVILSSFIPLLVWKISGFLTDLSGPRILAAGIAALEPLSVILSGLLITDVISVFFMISALYFFLTFREEIQLKYAISAGVLLGLSVLTKPNAQFLFILGGLVIFFYVLRSYSRFILASGVGFILAFLLVISPWVIRNHKEFGILSISSTGLRNIYTDFAVSVLNFETGRPYHEIENELTEEFKAKYKITADLEENPAYGKALLKEGLGVILEHPRATAGALLVTWNSFFTQDLYLYFLERFQIIRDFKIDFSPSLVFIKEGPWALLGLAWERTGGYLLIPVLGRLFWVFMNFLWIAGLVAAIRQGGKTRTVAIVFTVLILYYAFTSTVAGFSDHGRHRYPASPFMFILASLGLCSLLDYLRKGLGYRHQIKLI